MVLYALLNLQLSMLVAPFPSTLGILPKGSSLIFFLCVTLAILLTGRLYHACLGPCLYIFHVNRRVICE